MGSSSSKKVTSSTSNSNSNASDMDTNTNTTVAVGESKENGENAEKLEQLANETEESLEGDQSLPNLISCFSGLLQEPNLSGFKDVVIAMEDGWKQIMKALDSLEKYIGKEEIADMNVIHNEYWQLLLKTRVVMQILVKKCQLQKRNVRLLLKIIKKSQAENTTLTNDEKMTHSQCILKLSKWMTIEELDSLFKEWIAVEEKLKAKHKSWGAILAEIPQLSKDYMLKHIKKVCGLCAVISGVVIASVVICAVTYGTAIPLVFAGVGEFIAVTAGVTLATVALGSIAKISFGSLKDRKANKRACEVMSKVTGLLKKMIEGSQKIQVAMNKVKGESKLLALECDAYLEDGNTLMLMVDSLETIGTHLDNIIEQSGKVITTVDDTCDKIINC